MMRRQVTSAPTPAACASGSPALLQFGAQQDVQIFGSYFYLVPRVTGDVSNCVEEHSFEIRSLLETVSWMHTHTSV